MSPDFFDQVQADRYERFQFDFSSRTLAGKVILAPGGSGGLGAATVALLAYEGAQIVVGRSREASTTPSPKQPLFTLLGFWPGNGGHPCR